MSVRLDRKSPLEKQDLEQNLCSKYGPRKGLTTGEPRPPSQTQLGDRRAYPQETGGFDLIRKIPGVIRGNKEVRLGVEPSIKRFADAALATRDADLRYRRLESNQLIRLIRATPLPFGFGSIKKWTIQILT